VQSLSLEPTEHEIALKDVRRSDEHGVLIAVPGPRERQYRPLFSRKGVAGGGHSLSLFNERFIEARQLRGRHETCHDFNLAFINPVPRQCRHRPVGWLLGAVMGAAITAVATLAGWGLVALVTAGVTAGLFAAVVKKWRDEWQFETRHGEVPVFRVTVYRREREALLKLVKALSRRCEHAWQQLPQGKVRLAAEMAEHRRLHMAGAIDESQYRYAKQRIFRQY